MPTLLKRVLFGAGLVLVAFFGRLVLLAKESRTMSVERQLVDGRLAPCARTSNCVNTEGGPSISYGSMPVGTVERTVAEVIASAGGTVVLRESGHIAAEFHTGVFGFVDDLQVRVDPSTGQLHLRSASRVGNSDLGANGRRVRALQEELASALALVGGG